MITITTPVMESAASGISISSFMSCGAIASGILIAALIMQELLDTEDPSKSHHRKTMGVLDVAVQPLSVVFAITILYKVMEVLRF